MSDLGRGSEAVANYITICETVADTYPVSMAHGLQKDAIQNSLDARTGRGIVRVEFEVVQNNRNETFLTFRDTGTKGLTGAVVKDVSDYEKLKKEDHWARFEAFAFTKDDPDALGARGQGKFIFLCSSKQYKMFYDTLRGDGVYRLGATEAKKTGRSIYPERGSKWEGDTAIERLNKVCGLVPLEEVGTRIIVCEPREEVLEEIKNGAFKKAIQETWFRAIEKSQLEVWLNVFGKRVQIGLPSLYPLPGKDSQNNKVWVYGKDFNKSEINSNDGEFKIKRFCAVYFPEQEIPEELQGVAIVQNGMKICSVEMSAPSVDIPQKISGYIEFDIDLDRELRKGKNQNPHHYDLKWRSTTPRAIKTFINRQLEEFGRKKLGIGEDKREKEKRNRDNATKKALDLFARHAYDLDLQGPKRKGAGPGPTHPRSPKPPPDKPIGLIVQPRFPDLEKKPRVDWGEEISLDLICFNKTATSVRGLVSSKVLKGDSIIQTLFKDNLVELEPSSSDDLKPYMVKLNNGSPIAIKIDQSRYKNPGEYRIRTVLTDKDSGDEIDARVTKFWVEEDPPKRFPFDLVPTKLGEPYAWQPGGDIDNDPKIHYNTDHPQYKDAQKDEDDQANYLFNICLEGAVHFLLTRPYDAEGKADYHPLATDKIVAGSKDELPEIVYEQISTYIAEVRWRMFKE